MEAADTAEAADERRLSANARGTGSAPLSTCGSCDTYYNKKKSKISCFFFIFGIARFAHMPLTNQKLVVLSISSVADFYLSIKKGN